MSIRIAVTGGSGFIGTNIIQFYLDKGIDVINIDIAAPRNKNHLKYWQQVDILDLATLKKVICNFSPTHLIHLAARTDLNETHDISKYEANMRGIENIIEAINMHGKIKRTIFSSSMLVCERGYVPRDYDDYMPTTLYGRSKMSGEEIVKNHKNILSEWLIVRPTSIWGPWFEEPYRNFFDIIIKGKYVDLGNYSCAKTFGYVKNTVYQMDILLFSDDPHINHRTFYLGDYTPINISEWADQIAKVLGRKPFKKTPLIVFKVAALMGDILKSIGFHKFPMNSFRLQNMTKDNIIDLSDMQQLIPALPYSMEDGIKETLEWIQGA